MTVCHEFKKGQTYVCKSCGLELKIIKACTDCGPGSGACCADDCSFKCCGKDMKLVKAK